MRDQPDRSTPDGATIERLSRAARAAQQLCDVLWESLQEELRRADGQRVKEISERLVEISSTVVMLADVAPPGSSGSSNTGPSDVGSPVRAAGDAGLEGSPASGAASADADPSPRFVERRTPPPPSRPAPPPPAALQSIPTRGSDYTFTKLVDEREQAAPAQPPLASVEPIQPEIEIRDVRREEGPSAWVSSVGRLLARHAEDGLPFAVLLVEIVDVAHLERSETPHDLHGLVAQVESALGRGMRATDRLSRETLGRYWLVAPETNGTGARMLAERLARLVRTSAVHRGVPMEVAIGIAVCPDDGTEAPALAARADLGVYSARATGRSIAHTDPPPAG